MRVLAAIVVPPHLAVSGAARAAESLSEALAGHCDMTIATMLGGGAACAAGIGRLGRVPVRTSLPWGLSLPSVPKRYRTLFYRSDIGEIVKSGRYDLVHIHNPMPALEMRRIARTCRSLEIPYVVSTHGFNEVVNGLRVYAFNGLQRIVWRRFVVDPVRQVVAHAARVFALSPDDLDLIRTLGQRTDNVSVVSNGVPTPAAGDMARDDGLLARFDIRPRGTGMPPTFLFLANHTPNKGLPVLLEAFRRLDEPFQLIVGGERRQGISYGEHIAACGPGQRIVVTGRLTDAEAAACFRRADIFVFPTLADTFPLVVLEAMSNGLPVIASKVGGIPYQIGSDHGILVEPGDPEGLATALRGLMDDPQRAARLGAAAKARTRSEFTWERAAEIAFEGYRGVLAETRAAGASIRLPAETASRDGNVVRLR